MNGIDLDTFVPALAISMLSVFVYCHSSAVANPIPWSLVSLVLFPDGYYPNNIGLKDSVTLGLESIMHYHIIVGQFWITVLSICSQYLRNIGWEHFAALPNVWC